MDEPVAPPPTPHSARRELGGVGILGGIALAAFVFLRLASEVGEGETRSFDTGIMLALRHADDLARPIGPMWLQLTMLDVTAIGGTVGLTLLTLIAVGFLLAKRAYTRAAFLAVAVAGGSVLNTVMKIGYARPRPSLVAHLVDVTSASFPSGHAMNSAVTFLTLGVLLARAMPERRLKLYVLGVAITLTLLVGVSRVYLGVHWPTDVLAGWTVGAAWAGLCWVAAEWLNKRLAARRRVS